MRRTVFARLLPGFLPAAGLSAAAIAGSVLDPHGVAIQDAKASLYNPDTKTWQETASQTGGKFSFDHLSAGPYILRVDKPGYTPLLRAFNVAGDATVQRGIILQVQSVDGNADTAASTRLSPSPESGPLRIVGERQQEKLVSKVNPIYPASAKAAGIQGRVVLEAIIDAAGVPKDIQVVSSPDDALSQSALEAVRQWRYSTTLLNGNTMEVVTEILVNYTLVR